MQKWGYPSAGTKKIRTGEGIQKIFRSTASPSKGLSRVIYADMCAQRYWVGIGLCKKNRILDANSKIDALTKPFFAESAAFFHTHRKEQTTSYHLSQTSILQRANSRQQQAASGGTARGQKTPTHHPKYCKQNKKVSPCLNVLIIFSLWFTVVA